MSLQPDTVLVIGSDSPVRIVASKGRKEALIEELTCTITHSVMDPGITVGVLEDLVGDISTCLPRGLVGKERRGDRCRVDRPPLHPLSIPIVLGTPGTPAVHDFVGCALVVHVTYGEEDLILVGLVEYTVVDEVARLVEEVEAEPPALQSSTDDTDVVGALLALALLEVSDGAPPLDLHPRPRARGVVNDGELLLSPGGILVDEVPVHHPVSVGVPLLEHHKAGRPVAEGSPGIGVRESTVCYLDLLETIDVVVCPTSGDGLG